jgi:hypothetical protein
MLSRHELFLQRPVTLERRNVRSLFKSPNAMLRRIVVAITVASVSLGRVYAQTPDHRLETRIRVTGAETYDIPGVLAIGGGRITGPSAVVNETTITLRSPETGQPLAVVRPGVRLAGRAIAVNQQVVSFIVEGDQNPIAIPLPSIGKLEVSEHRSPRHLVRGILVGVGVFYGTSWLIFAKCGLGCSNAAILPPIAAGIAAGTITGRSRETWKVVPVDWLLAHVGVQAADVTRTAAAQTAR